MILTIDFETRSRIGISAGAWKYAAHDSTEWICLAIKQDGQEPRIMWNPKFALRLNLISDITLSEFSVLVSRAGVIESHNAEFEIAILQHQPYFETIKHSIIDKISCTLARARTACLPGSLEKLCQALQVKQRKDMQGSLIMKKICRPDKSGSWVEDQALFLCLAEYCKQDTNAQYACSCALPQLSLEERDVWRHTVIMNRRGIPVDVDLVQKAIKLNAVFMASAREEFKQLTGIPSPGCLEQVKAWLLEKGGISVPDLQANTVSVLLDQENLSAEVRRVLELRQISSRSSVAKYTALEETCSPSDNRVRGTIIYHGANTGRFAGGGFQPHNLPKRGLISDIKTATRLIKNGASYQFIQRLWPEGIGKVLSSCIRSAVYSKKGLIGADYSAIEARVLAWLAGEWWKISAYEEGKDPYVTIASSVFGVPEAQISKSQRQVGKVADLSCGYQGGVSAFQSMAKNYSVLLPDDKAGEIIAAWRQKHPQVVKLWRDIGDTAIEATHTSQPVACGRDIEFAKWQNYLTCTLPSGRKLYYPFPEIRLKPAPWGADVPALYYKAVVNSQWVTVNTYGGCLVENITQAIARDILVYALLALEKEGVPIVFHVHDEFIGEGHEHYEKFCRVVSTAKPKWAEGLPLECKPWKSERFSKI